MERGAGHGHGAGGRGARGHWARGRGRGGSGRGAAVVAAAPLGVAGDPLILAAVEGAGHVAGHVARRLVAVEEVAATASEQQTVTVDHLKKLNRDKPGNEPFIPIPHGGQAHPPFFPAVLTRDSVYDITEAEVTAILEGYGVELDAADTHMRKVCKLLRFLTGP